MPNLRQLKRRGRTIESTIKVTGAMEMIAASKMRRAQQNVLAGRPYSESIASLLGHLVTQLEPGEATHPLMEQREVKNLGMVLITADRGLCGGLNSNANRVAAQTIVSSGVPANLFTVGKKGRDFMVRSGSNVQAVFTDLGDYPKLDSILPLATLIAQEYESGSIDEVQLIYNKFINVQVQQPVAQKILPLEPDGEIEVNKQIGYIYEPGPAEVLNALAPRYLEVLIYQAILESIASEQASRMVAMRNATDNANNMLDDLTLQINKVRQESITGELLDIIGGVAALEG